ncbi:MAG: sugar phosphate isomerase/epimerase [Cyclobacteriaceae bacterium]
MTTRRNFTKLSGLTVLGSAVAPLTFGQSKDDIGTMLHNTLNQSKPMGVQAYSVRQALSKDFQGSMKQIADIGYQFIEGYGLGLDGKLFGMSPVDYKNIVDDLGMKLISTHTTYFTPKDAGKVIEAAGESGVKYLVIPYLDDALRDDYYQIAANLNAVGELFKGSGIKFCYHNHAFEFEKMNGEIPLDILIKETDPELVSFEADLYWIKRGGYDPLTYLKQYPGRFSLFHVKDAAKNLKQTTVGAGTLDFESLINAKNELGLEYYFVEDERTKDPFGNISKAFDHMMTLDI